MITFQARTERAWASIYIHKIYRTCSNHHTREHWMIYRGPGFLAVVYDSAPRPSPFLTSRQQVVFLCVYRRSSWLTGGRRGREMVVEPNRTTTRKSLALNKSFNTLCITPSLSPSLPLSLPKSMHHPYREYRLRRWIVFRQRPQKYHYLVLCFCVSWWKLGGGGLWGWYWNCLCVNNLAGLCLISIAYATV
jgi:hypothetical protein